MLRSDVGHDEYWAELHRSGDEWWTGAVNTIAERNGLAFGSVERAPFGRNVVLYAGDYVLKLVPPFWRHMWANERVALEAVHGRLSVTTPELVASGELNGWGYLVMERLAGESYGWRAENASTSQRLDLAALQGRLVKEISGLPPIPALRWEWEEIIDEDRQELEARLEGVPSHLVATAGEYVDAAGDLSSGSTMLHGDVSSINLLHDGGRTVLVDWSDASIGPADHEFISPMHHQFKGESDVLEAFWEGYGSLDDPESTRQRIMARSIIKYAALMGRFLIEMAGPEPQSWGELAERYTGIS